MRIGSVAKAVVGLVALSALGAQDAIADNVLELSEGLDWATKVITAAVGVWGIYRVPNADATERPRV